MAPNRRISARRCARFRVERPEKYRLGGMCLIETQDIDDIREWRLHPVPRSCSNFA